MARKVKKNNSFFLPLFILVIGALLIGGYYLIRSNKLVLGDSDSAKLAWVGGYVYEDLNNNGDRDVNEPGKADQQILFTLISSKNQPLKGPAYVRTDSNGYFRYKYKATSADAVNYSVQATWPGGYTNTTPIAKKFAFSVDKKKLAEFGIAQVKGYNSCKSYKVITYKENCGGVGSNKVRYASYTCSDGTKGTMGGSTSCKTTDTWEVYVNDACKSHGSCNVPTSIPTPSLVPPLAIPSE